MKREIFKGCAQNASWPLSSRVFVDTPSQTERWQPSFFKSTRLHATVRTVCAHTRFSGTHAEANMATSHTLENAFNWKQAPSFLFFLEMHPQVKTNEETSLLKENVYLLVAFPNILSSNKICMAVSSANIWPLPWHWDSVCAVERQRAKRPRCQMWAHNWSTGILMWVMTAQVSLL